MEKLERVGRGEEMQMLAIIFGLVGFRQLFRMPGGGEREELRLELSIPGNQLMSAGFLET